MPDLDRPDIDGRYKTRLVLVDQALVSGVNFTTGIVLARFLGPEGYGQYVLANGIILFVAGIQMALIISPMMVTGAPLRDAEARAYYKTVIAQQLLFCAVMILVVAAGGYAAERVFQQIKLDQILWPLLGTLICFICQDFFRRYLFSRNRSDLALANDAISYLLRILLLVTVGFFVGLSAPLALGLLAAGSFVGFVVALVGYMRSAKEESYGQMAFVATAWRHWNFGKWLLGSNIAYWIGSQAMIYLTATMLNIAVTGAMAATLNIVAVANILFLALENFVPVRAAKAYASGGIVMLNNYLCRVAVFGAVGTIGLVAVAAVGAEFWLALVYDNAYSGYGWVVYWWAFYYLISFFQRPLSAGLRVLGQTRAIFSSSLCGAVVTLMLGVPAIYYSGLQGAMLSLCGAQAVMIGVMAVLYQNACANDLSTQHQPGRTVESSGT